MNATITLLPGDGIGPEVLAEGVRALRAIEQRFHHQFYFTEALIGGAAIDATGFPLPDDSLARCQASQAVLLGAVGGPKWDDPNAKVRPEQGLLGIRKGLGLFANLRPVTVYPQLIASSPLQPERLVGVDMLVLRELTGGIYFGEKGRTRLADGQESAFDVCTYTTSEIERIVRMAATFARARRGKLTSVDKANVLETSRLWRSTTTRLVRDEFPDIQLEHTLVDSFAMHLLRRPADFDVVVTENMFGDILTDEASMLAGSMGMLPSASLGAPAAAGATRMGLYEPIHGSAPDIAGKSLANPMATILSVAMLLRYSLNLQDEAQTIERAVTAVLEAAVVTSDVAATGCRTYSTVEVGQAIVTAIAEV